MTQIQLRRDTADNWTTANPILAQGEVGIDLTNKLIKIGDGATAWNNLNDYAGDYNDILNKPQINNITLSGNKTGAELGLQNTLTAGDNITITSNTISANIPVATTTTAGIVKPDGSTITITEDGTITAVGSGEAPANMVTTNSQQTITANKRLANNVELQFGTNNNARLNYTGSYVNAFGIFRFQQDIQTSGIDASTASFSINTNNAGGTKNLSFGGSGTNLRWSNIRFYTDTNIEKRTSSGTYVILDTNNIGNYTVTTTQGIKLWKGTQTEYEGITSKDENTLYIITGA